MRNIAEFQIIGRVGKITPKDKVLFLNVASSYPRKNDKGEWDDNPYWNTVTIFNDNVRKYLDDHLGVGDLVHLRGRLKDSNFEREGETIYSVDLIADEVGILAKAPEKAD